MEKLVAAHLYPKRIIISTRVTNENGSVWSETDSLSILAPEISNEELGVVVLFNCYK